MVKFHLFYLTKEFNRDREKQEHPPQSASFMNAHVKIQPTKNFQQSYKDRAEKRLLFDL